MRTQLRIVAGSLRGRKLTCTVNEHLRPAPQRVREALFSILGDAVPGRPFFDLFAGTGAVGLEALSRGASHVTFLERDFRAAGEIDRHLREFDVVERGNVVRADVYRWESHWNGVPEPANVFIGPPYPDFARRSKELWTLVAGLQQKLMPGSILVLQSERLESDTLPPKKSEWDERRYGRNHLGIWVKESAANGVQIEPN